MFQLIAFVVASFGLAIEAYPRKPDIIEIINGTNVIAGEIPFIVSIQTLWGHICGGSIYNAETIITAAHCLGESADTYQILAGTTNSNDRKHGQLIRVKSYIIHSGYNSNNLYANDIALIFLDGSLAYNNYVAPINTPKSSFSGSSAIVAGWGLTEPWTTDSLMVSGRSNSLQKALKEATVPIVPLDVCQSYWPFVTGAQLCTGGTDDITSACNGDSGGPLFSKDSCFNDAGSCVSELIGIVSLGVRGCYSDQHYPEIYTNVFEYVDWIVKNAQ